MDAADEEEPKPLPDDIYAMLSQEPADAPRDPISIQNYIDPGAGLRHLEDWVQDSDFLFDSLFMNSTGPAVATDGYAPDLSGAGTPPHAIPMVRTYQSDAAILDAYYVFIHPYLPILPPPTGIPVDQPVPRLQSQLGVFDEAFEPSSPVALALAAVLALVPAPADAAPHAREAQLFRRKYAQYLAQRAFEALEGDDEIPASAVAPPRALGEAHDYDGGSGGGGGGHPARRPFHPRVPVRLERVAALCVLSVYEYAQRGNLRKMQNRAGQAMLGAMDAALHTCALEDEFSEARRRIWWMSCICVAQGAIVSNMKPSLVVFSPSYTAKLPVLAADPEAFLVYLQAQRAILAATQFVIELNGAVREGADMRPIRDRMRELEASLAPLLARSEAWRLASTTTSPVDPSEEVVARSLRCMASIKLNSARIKVHRYCAFFDLPVFSRRHCDLASLHDHDAAGAGDDEPRRWPACSCATFANAFPGSVLGSATTPATTTTGSASASASGTTPAGLSPSASASSSSDGPGGGYVPPPMPAPTPPPPPPTPPVADFPFGSHQSARICLRSALAIARGFDELPYPNPRGAPPQPRGPPVFLGPPGPAGGVPCPRTMPSFACCAMQCAYALLMVHQRTRAGSAAAAAAAGGGGGDGYPAPAPPSSPPRGPMLAVLQQGLASIYATLSNYAVASEALGGMRDQIRSAIEESAAFVV